MEIPNPIEVRVVVEDLGTLIEQLKLAKCEAKGFREELEKIAELQEKIALDKEE